MTNRVPRLPRRDAMMDPDRLVTFGDAVIAIAITLLALDITVPEGLADGEVGAALRDALPKFGAYLLSFAVIGALWLGQHALFRQIAALDNWLLRLYLALLAVVAALPFPTRLISEYGNTAVATSVYAATIVLAVGLLTAMSARLWASPALAKPTVHRAQIRQSVLRGLLTVLVFATSIPVSLASPTAAKYWWLLTVPARLLFRETSTPDREQLTAAVE
ncbi:TMEM175 family protein [Streptomyces mirabilis]|uniref:TMEM175 family protein n=1 Tax=Streptomyces mirabilis TaxID=68239 RepID=UPI0036A30920